MLKSKKWNDNNNNYIPVTTATIYACFILSHRIRFCSFDGNTRPLQSSILHNDFYSSVIYFAGAGFFSPSYTQKAHVSFLNKTQHTVDVLRFLNFASIYMKSRKRHSTAMSAGEKNKTKQKKGKEKRSWRGNNPLLCFSLTAPTHHMPFGANYIFFLPTSCPWSKASLSNHWA